MNGTQPKSNLGMLHIMLDSHRVRDVESRHPSFATASRRWAT